MLGWIVVAAFFIDLVIRIVLVDGSRLRYLIRHWPDVTIVVLSLLPIARPLRALRALQMLRGIRALMATHKAVTTLTHTWTNMQGKALIVSSALLSIVSLIIVYEAERTAGGNINSLEDTLWWAASTITTVGYGDLSPSTTVARVAAVCLMICGVSLFGLLTANVSAKFLKNDALLTYNKFAKLSGADRPCPNCGYKRTSLAGNANYPSDDNPPETTEHEQT